MNTAPTPARATVFMDPGLRVPIEVRLRWGPSRDDGKGQDDPALGSKLNQRVDFVLRW